MTQFSNFPRPAQAIYHSQRLKFRKNRLRAAHITHMHSHKEPVAGLGMKLRLDSEMPLTSSWEFWNSPNDMGKAARKLNV